MTVRILLTRHGQPTAHRIPEIYLMGDTNVELTDDGWVQTDMMGQFLGEYCPAVGMTEWPLFYVSPHFRAKQSASGIVNGMGKAFPGEPEMHLQSFLSEKFFGAASVLEFPDGKVPPEIIDAIKHLSKLVYEVNPFTASHLFGESTKDTMLAAKVLINGTLRRDIEQGTTNFVVVCHGEVILATVMAWAHIDPKDKKLLGKIGHADVIEIVGEPKHWTIKKIYDGEAGKAVDIDLLANLRPFSFADLPAVPDFLKRKPV